MHDWHFGYEFLTDVVGESNYQRALNKCYKDKDAYHKGNSAFIDVDLVFETQNEYDANAVAVISKHGKIGYLSKADAIRYRHLCEGSRDTLSVRCKIYRGKKNIYGAWVDLDLEDLPATAKSLSKYNHQPPPLTDSHSQVTRTETDHSNKKAKTIFFIIVFILVIIAIRNM